ncbi:MAG: dihydroxy-acid dehydratase [Firmicutes bacterium]|nr:dihydroxy-acid dehydratase [Bacillota bacterium]
MSREIFSIDKFFTKHTLSSFGLSDDDLTKPRVLVFVESGCETEGEHVKYGVMTGGCAAIPLTLPALDGRGVQSMGRSSLLYARETTADMVEALLNLYCADGAAIVASSESSAAGAIMGAVRRNVPLAFLPSFINSKFYPSHLYNIRSRVSVGKAALSELESLGDVSCGRSAEMDNMGSLCVFLEGCGIAVKDATGAATTDEQVRAARASGLLAAKRTVALSYPRTDLTRDGIKCGVAAFISAGGTAAALLHILAIAEENQTDFRLSDVADLKLPRLASIAPFGQHSIVEFTRAGGVFALFNALLGLPKLLPNIKIGGLSIADAASTNDHDVISKLSAPFAQEGGFGLLNGNMMDCGVFKRETKLKSFKGNAVVVGSEEQLKAAAGDIKNGSVVIIKGQSADKLGMPLLDVMSACLAVGLTDVVIVTDGRVLETADIPCISLCHGEAFDVIKNGESVEIDFKKGKINVDLPGKEFSQRLKKQKPPEDALSGGLLRYSRLVGDPDTGCALKKKF